MEVFFASSGFMMPRESCAVTIDEKKAKYFDYHDRLCDKRFHRSISFRGLHEKHRLKNYRKQNDASHATRQIIFCIGDVKTVSVS